jgi:hypothetical protein
LDDSNEPVALIPAPPDAPCGLGTRGRQKPRGVAWFGFKTFWGHLQHLIASAIATEDIDSRDWMQPDEPQRLADRVASHLLGARVQTPHGRVQSVAETIGREVWLDYIADTGDDVSVSEAMGRLVSKPYRVAPADAPEDAEPTFELPRGDILMFGGDTAYPVATEAEIHDRVVVPFNRALVDARDERRRVLLGIPGNHDWYDGLDGFGRLFRKRQGDVALDDAPPPSLELGRETRIRHALQWVEKFASKGHVQKRKILALDGYVPVQQASYFLLPIAKGLDLYGVDRQLRSVDFRQRRFFTGWRDAHADRRAVVAIPDPVYAHLEPSDTGVATVRAIDLDLENTPNLILSGDIHHYNRMVEGPTMHVTAGGGGAFVHGAPLRPRRQRPVKEWPGPIASRSMLLRVPLHLMFGGAGWIPHVVLFLLFAPALGFGLLFSHSANGVLAATIFCGVVSAIACMLLGGVRRPRGGIVALLSLGTGLWSALVPIVTFEIFRAIAHRFGFTLGARGDAFIVLCVASFSGTLAFAAYLVALTWLGLESTQAFAAIGHPGFKHFVRMRIAADGQRVDGWTIGLLDPLAKDARPVLVDRFSFRVREDV